MIYGSDWDTRCQRLRLQQAIFVTRVYNRSFRPRLLLEYAATVNRFCQSVKGPPAMRYRNVADANRAMSLQSWLRQQWGAKT